MKNSFFTIIVICLSLFSISCSDEDDSEKFTLEIVNSNVLNLLEVSSNAFKTTLLPQYIQIEGEVKDEVQVTIHMAGDPDDVVHTTTFSPVADGIYGWSSNPSTELYIIEEPGGGSNDLVGKWENLSGCLSSNNEQTYFRFKEDGTGEIFNVDCNNTCPPYGYYIYFTWTATSTIISVNYTGVSEYCFTIPTPPASEEIPYSISNNDLSLGGVTFSRL